MFCLHCIYYFYFYISLSLSCRFTIVLICSCNRLPLCEIKQIIFSYLDFYSTSDLLHHLLHRLILVTFIFLIYFNVSIFTAHVTTFTIVCKYILLSSLNYLSSVHVCSLFIYYSLWCLQTHDFFMLACLAYKKKKETQAHRCCR